MILCMGADWIGPTVLLTCFGFAFGAAFAALFRMFEAVLRNLPMEEGK